RVCSSTTRSTRIAPARAGFFACPPLPARPTALTACARVTCSPRSANVFWVGSLTVRRWVKLARGFRFGYPYNRCRDARPSINAGCGLFLATQQTRKPAMTDLVQELKDL